MEDAPPEEPAPTHRGVIVDIRLKSCRDFSSFALPPVEPPALAALPRRRSQNLFARGRHDKVLAPAATVVSRVAQTSSYRKLGTPVETLPPHTRIRYYWLCLTVLAVPH